MTSKQHPDTGRRGGARHERQALEERLREHGIEEVLLLRVAFSTAAPHRDRTP